MHDGFGANNRLDFLLGGGQLGTRIRAYNRTATPLGYPECWSQALKTLVGTMLVSA